MTQAHPTTGATPDPECPVSLELLGQVYRADDYDLPELLASIPAPTRARLAAYLYGKSHMHQLGLRVARACEREDLVGAVGEIGAVIHGQSRLKPSAPVEEPVVKLKARRGAAEAPAAKKKISLGGSAAKGRVFDFD